MTTNSRSVNKILNLGFPAELPTNVLPTNGDIVRSFYFERQILMNQKCSNKVPTKNETKAILIPKVVQLWKNSSLPHVSTAAISKRLDSLIDEINKFKSQPHAKLNSPKFKENLDNLLATSSKLFDICTCKCNWSETVWHSKMVCTCPFERRVPQIELKFLMDQRFERKMFIGKVDKSETRRITEYARKNPHYRSDSCTSAAVSSSHSGSFASGNYQDSSSATDSDCSASVSSANEDSEQSEFEENSLSTRPSVLSATATKISAKTRTSVRATAGLLNSAAEKLGVPQAKRCKSSVYNHNIKTREAMMDQSLVKFRNASFHQLAFDGIKIFGRERLVALSTFLNGSHLLGIKTFRKEESVTGAALFESVRDMLESDNTQLMENLLCVMSDTTAVNTGVHRGAVPRIINYCNKNYEHDILSLECMFHCIELMLGDIINAYEGDTKSPETLDGDAVFNNIKKLSKRDLVSAKIKSHEEITIKPSEMSQKLLSAYLDNSSSDHTKKSIRDDQACLLTLACATYRTVPEKWRKYLFYDQEIVHHARWMTKANGYLRILLFSPFNLTSDQQNVLHNVCKYVIDVYAPMFISIFTHPSVVDGPYLTLLNRDLMHASDPTVVQYAIPSFLKHGSLWVSPKNVALASLSDQPPVLQQNVKKICNKPLDQPTTQKLLLGKKKLSYFYDITSQCSPCLTMATPDVWRSFRNNQMPNERAIGMVKMCLLERKVKDSSDSETNETIHEVDERIRAYVISMMP